MKTDLTPEERIKVAYLHLLCGVTQQHLAIAYEVNSGRINEAVTALKLAADDPKGTRSKVEAADEA